jgi:hypothetical protein
MSFTVSFGDEFAKRDWPNLLPQQKILVGDFVSLVKQYGLDPTKLPGKFSPSWLNAGGQNFQYAQQHNLWHYHVGYPAWRVNAPGQPLTSEWVVHFQWVNGSSHIDVIDLYEHYDWRGNFYLPPTAYLSTPAPTATPSPSSPPTSAP